jgi:hypothetical protein
MRGREGWSDIFSEDGRWDSLMMHPPPLSPPPVYCPEPNRVPAPLTHGISFQLDTKSPKNLKAKSMLSREQDEGSRPRKNPELLAMCMFRLLKG